MTPCCRILANGTNAAQGFGEPSWASHKGDRDNVRSHAKNASLNLFTLTQRPDQAAGPSANDDGTLKTCKISVNLKEQNVRADAQDERLCLEIISSTSMQMIVGSEPTL